MDDRISTVRRHLKAAFAGRRFGLALAAAAVLTAVGCAAQTEEAREQARQDLERLQLEREATERQRQQDQLIFQ